MLSVHFGADDLARTRLRPTVGPAGETVFALALLRRSGAAAFAPWRAEAHRRVRGRLAAANPVIACRPALLLPDDLLGLVVPPPSEQDGPAPSGGGLACDMSAERAEAAVLELWRVLLAPYWRRILDRLAADREHRARIMAAGGVEALLASLEPRVRWRAPVLEVDDGQEARLSLAGGGLLLCPSVFVGAPRLLGAAGRLTLVYPVPVDVTLWGADAGHRALVDLVGQTRADALRALTESCGTGELAGRLGISSAGASQHTAVLRRSGLITTRRIHNTVLHAVTPLGHALLGGRVADG